MFKSSDGVDIEGLNESVTEETILNENQFALNETPLIFEIPNTINGKNLSFHHGMGKYEIQF